MIKKVTFSGIFLGLTVTGTTAQNEQTTHKFTLDDLEPKINYTQSEPFFRPIREKQAGHCSVQLLFPEAAKLPTKNGGEQGYILWQKRC